MNSSFRIYLANMGVGGSLAFMGDYVCQFFEASRGAENLRFDWNRNLSFTVFGTFYMGGVANIIYTRSIPWLLSKKITHKLFALNRGNRDLRKGFAGSMIDNTLHAPFFYLPSYFIFTDFMRGRDSDYILEHLNRSYKISLVSLWCIWIPVQTITFSVMPTHLRAAFVNTICLIWNIWLDFYTNVPEVEVQNEKKEDCNDHNNNKNMM